MAALFVELSTRWLDDRQQQQIRKWVERMDLVKEIVEDAVEIAVEKALETGRQEGREEGRREAWLEMARRLLAAGESFERVADLTGLSVEQVRALASAQ